MKASEKKGKSSSEKTAVRKYSHRGGLNSSLMIALMILCVAVTAAFAVNIVRISSASSGDGAQESMTVNTDRTMKNDQYEIGNNPTDIEKTYFQELTDAVKSGDEKAVCEAVVKNFVTDSFTRTNKDGNYEVGGLQYIFGSKYAVFEEWSRYNYYADLDLYINQYGRDNLLQVKEVTVDKETAVAPDFATTEWSDDVKTDILYKSYEVNVSWTYENCALDTEQFVDGARFFLVNNNGRWEIAEFYDYDSIHEWEVENGLASAAEGGLS